jgi:hypothetical protein
MMPVDSVFDTRASLELATFFVTWVAVALLTVIVVHLHLRLVRLERASAASGRVAPYAHLIGQRVSTLTGATDDWQPAFFLFLSASCAACEKILRELTAPGWQIPVALAWVDAVPAAAPALSSGVRILQDGKAISTALGIHATPFVIVLDEEGRVNRAMPINSLEAIARGVRPRLSAIEAREPGRELDEVAS